MRYYWFNRQELLEKANDGYHNCGGKEKTAQYYILNKEFVKEKANNKYRNLSEEENEANREYAKGEYKTIKNK